MTTILLPDPSLVLLIGAAGAGKTTFAARHFAADEVLSSDAYRGLVSGDEANQAASRVAFRILHRELERRLGAGLLTVVDATNATPRNRAQLLERARIAGVPVVALVFALPAAVVLARNATRSRRVDEEVVRRQLEQVAVAAGNGVLTAEGCAAVSILRTPDVVDAVTLARLPSGVAPVVSQNPRRRPQ